MELIWVHRKRISLSENIVVNKEATSFWSGFLMKNLDGDYANE